MNRISTYDTYLFGQGTHYEMYEKLGAHPCIQNSEKGVDFAVWAPNARRVWVIGEFNDWNETSHPMKRLEHNGIYELFVPEARIGQMYKFLIETATGKKLYKADPYANYAELRPGTASRIWNIDRLKWTDDEWIKKRSQMSDADVYAMPMAIYEVHPGSWRRYTDEEGDGFYTYREFARELTRYVKHMGYTHVELMGILEHPFDGSWGYQVTGYFAPTSRYGTPDDFAYMINYLHNHGIGVILDWVPAHFPKDAHGLAEFDGSCLYEYADPRKGEHPDWGTKIFDYGKNEVRGFLINSALMWVEKYHVDGLRVDAVASMLYLDYGKKDGEWVPNKYGGNKNLEAIDFFRHINTLIRGRNHGVAMIAEESTAWDGVTRSAEEDGLNFTFKWNMGWMHDFLDYMKQDPLYRKGNHSKMTFAMSYNTSEKYILVLSHDEVVHLKCSMINKMPGLGPDKFRNLMAGYAFMMGHCGKKLLFMGQDFGQLHEWDEKTQLEWHLLEKPWHKHLQDFCRALLRIYSRYPACYQLDDSWDGFEWINADDASRSIFSFVRHPKDREEESLLFVINFTPVARPDYRVGVPKDASYRLILNSDDVKYGGTGKKRHVVYHAQHSPCDGRSYSFAYDLPGYGVAIFRYK